MILNREIGKYIKYPPINYAIIVLIVIIILLILYKYPLTTLSFIVTPILTILFIIIWDGINSKKEEESIFRSPLT
jgi:L-asparagine transporter-like permease